MPRDIEPRKTFSPDVMYMGRLSRSLEIDHSLDTGWRKDTIAACQALMMLLLKVKYKPSSEHDFNVKKKK